MRKNESVTINDVAKAAGVSISTVSRYLNQNYTYMREETKEKISTVIRSLHYRPNPLAQGLKSRSHTVAIVVTDLDYPLCVSVTRELFKVLDEKGYNLLVCETDGDAKREANILQSLVARSVDGIVIQTNGGNSQYIKQISQEIPFIFFDRQYSIPYTVNLVTNNLEVSKELTCDCFAEGYEEVLYLTEELFLSTRLQRCQGYEEACALNRRRPRIFVVNRKEPGTFSPVLAELGTLTEAKKTAVYTANGLIMLRLFPYLKRLGKGIPDPLGLATFDEPDWSEIMVPRLTCISQPAELMGRTAARMLLQTIKSGARTARPKTRVFDSSLVWGGSSSLTGNCSAPAARKKETGA